MATSFPVLCSFLFFILIHWMSPSGPQRWWPPHGKFKVKCPHRKEDFSLFRVTVNPCIGIYQPICGTNMVTYDNPCTLCIESLKSHGKIRFLHDGAC
ncbi:serine protease inhibitor Kazal-type 14 [Desmodus rotundus]|uniref:serine protease inhibitor Kazal-type 14 n=1 Tax=Desmodus rotundus TaxID=9430 RepID=UPI000D182173|nr:serine protease inhibitor Kazal-type 14 [Desmodus rotundus]